MNGRRRWRRAHGAVVLDRNDLPQQDRLNGRQPQVILN
jgi:hypothetical protein